MPEFLFPGVFVEEVDSGTHAIPGVPTRTLDTATARKLIAAFAPLLEFPRPPWTDQNAHDPGTTLLELCAWLVEGLAWDTAADTPRRRAVLDALRAALQRTAGPCPESTAPLKRPRWFAGQVLTAEALQLEQDYLRGKRRRHNLNLHGSGIVTGLDVVVAGDAGDRVIVRAGCAIDPCGEEVELACDVGLALPSGAAATFVTLRHYEHPGGATPASGGGIEGSFVEEAALLACADTVAPPELALARLVRGATGWCVDGSFRPPRL